MPVTSSSARLTEIRDGCSADQQLAFPQPIFYMTNGSVRGYIAHSGASPESPALQKHLRDRPALSVRSIIHSAKQDMLVVFFTNAGEEREPVIQSHSNFT